MINIAINGYGRIGRNILRALYEGHYREQIKIVAINDLGNTNSNVHLTKYDTVHGRFNAEVSLLESDPSKPQMIVNGDPIQLFSQKDPAALPWKSLDVDIVFECTGFFTERELAEKHIEAGARKVLISAPGSNVDQTIVYGVNHQKLKSKHTIISNASCTTNCLAPVAQILNDAIGIKSGLMTTVHAFTNDQKLIDAAHSDIYRARSATHSMIPTKTGAAKAVGIVLPELAGKLDGMAIRVPTINVSVVDLSFIANRDTSVEEVNQLIENAAKNEMAGILNYVREPLVSIDFNHHPASSNFDPAQTKVLGRMVKIMSWYDNEWGFSNRMLDTGVELIACEQQSDLRKAV